MSAVALVLLLLAPSPIDGWIEDLESPSPDIRRFATRELIRAGEEAAVALEQREFRTPEARLVVDEILDRIRVPRATLRIPGRIGDFRDTMTIEVVVHNPGRRPVTIEPVLPRARRPAWNARWTIEISDEAGTVVRDRRLLARTTQVEPRGWGVVPIGLKLNIDEQKSFGISVRYEGDNFRLECRSLVHVDRESTSQLQRSLGSPIAQTRADALEALRTELGSGRTDAAFAGLFRQAARSGHRDVRLGAVEALLRHGHPGNRVHIEASCQFVFDKDRAVARAACEAYVALVESRRRPEEAYRTAAKMLARADEPQADWLEAGLARWDARARHSFLVGVLQRSRTSAVHERIAAIYRREGVPVEVGTYGLIPRGEFTRLR